MEEISDKNCFICSEYLGAFKNSLSTEIENSGRKVCELIGTKFILLDVSCQMP